MLSIWTEACWQIGEIRQLRASRTVTQRIDGSTCKGTRLSRFPVDVRSTYILEKSASTNSTPKTQKTNHSCYRGRCPDPLTNPTTSPTCNKPRSTFESRFNNFGWPYKSALTQSTAIKRPTIIFKPIPSVKQFVHKILNLLPSEQGKKNSLPCPTNPQNRYNQIFFTVCWPFFREHQAG